MRDLWLREGVPEQEISSMLDNMLQEMEIDPCQKSDEISYELKILMLIMLE